MTGKDTQGSAGGGGVWEMIKDQLRAHGIDVDALCCGEAEGARMKIVCVAPDLKQNARRVGRDRVGQKPVGGRRPVHPRGTEGPRHRVGTAQGRARRRGGGQEAAAREGPGRLRRPAGMSVTVPLVGEQVRGWRRCRKEES
jgi:hypothetical protein